MIVRPFVFDSKEHASRTSHAAHIGTFGIALGLHVALAAWVSQARFDTPSRPVPVRMEVRTIAMSMQRQEVSVPVAQQPKPLPQAARPDARPIVRHIPTPPQTAPAAAPKAESAPASLTTAPQASPAREEAVPAPVVAPAPVTAARFDADYLQNPPPAFPMLSRKLHEEGKVLLLVQVSARGEAGAIQIKQSSGYPRLDDAAISAVRTWRFIPARRGTEPVASSVVVPLVFRLDS